MKRPYIFILLLLSMPSCNDNKISRGYKLPPTRKLKTGALFSCAIPDSVFQTNQPISALFQDKGGNLWIGTFGDGVYLYDGKAYTRFSEKEGLANNFVSSIIEDSAGNMWFCSKAEGVCRYDGKTFTNFTDKNNTTDNRSASCGIKDKNENLWFGTGGGAYRYNGKSFSYWQLPMEGADIKASEMQPGFNPFCYTVYHMLEDKDGNIWFGTACKGMCCYNGMFCTWYKDKDLGTAAIRSVFMDHDGVLWFGNNGGGAYSYDGKTLNNITEEKGLGNSGFLRGIDLNDKPGNIARVFAIGEDKNNNTWFGTIDGGAWKYDGKNVTNFTTNDGLKGNMIRAIFKDNNDNLWIGTDSGGLCKYDG